jgi:carbon storage regulator
MLVLSRRVGEEIVIDGNIRVKVLAIRGSVIRLGIDAPTDIHVARLELLAKKRVDPPMLVTANSPQSEPNADPASPISS